MFCWTSVRARTAAPAGLSSSIRPAPGFWPVSSSALQLFLFADIKSRQEVLDMGIDKYNEECRSIVMRYSKDWEAIVHRLGRWIDFEVISGGADLKWKAQREYSPYGGSSLGQPWVGRPAWAWAGC